MIKKYNSKPVTIEAIRYMPGTIAEILQWTRPETFLGDEGQLVIRTLEGNMQAGLGDYIIKGLKGEFYPCKADIFEQKYEEVI